jgi:hypothetical protein
LKVNHYPWCYHNPQANRDVAQTNTIPILLSTRFSLFLDKNIHAQEGYCLASEPLLDAMASLAGTH